MLNPKLKKSLIWTTLFLLVGMVGYGQAGSGEVYGVVSDNSGPLPGASIILTSGGILKSRIKTDNDGKYSIKPLPSGNYEIEASFIGIGNKKVEFYLGTDASYKQNIVLGEKEGDNVIKGKEIVISAKPILSNRPAESTISGTQINQQATRSTGDIANLGLGVTTTGKAGDNSKVSIDGGRNENTVYIIDGVVVRGSRNVNLPIGSMSAIEVMGSGLPAKYGDATGGVIAITTKGISRDIHGGIYGERSLEGFGHNQISGNISGPFLQRVDKETNTKMPIAGFMIAVDYINDKDGNPNFYKNIKLKDDYLTFLQQNPLTRSANGGLSFQNQDEFTTWNNIEYTKARLNARREAGQLVTKLDFMPNLQTNITIGFQLNYNKQADWNRRNMLFAPDANPLNTNYTGRTYLRFTRRIPDSKDPNVKDPIRNAYITGQISYQKDFYGNQNPTFKGDFFKYGYVGKFEENRVPVFQPLGLDSLSGRLGYKLAGYRSDDLTFVRSEDNSVLANYTDYVMQNANVNSLQTVQNLGGMRNGDLPSRAYGLYEGIGLQNRSYLRSQSDQIAINFETGFTLSPGKGKTQHNIEIGVYYEQRNDRIYSLAGAGLWNLMRLSVNRHLANFDYSNPIYRIDGQNYSYNQIMNGDVAFTSTDSIFYNYKYDASNQAFIDKNIRQKLGLAVDNTDYIQVDALDPSFFSLNMFSADDLLNQGQSYVSYYGYTHDGQVQRGKVSFNSFFLDKDANGNFSRKVGSFQPVYMAGYIMDKFRYRDISLNFGIRIDRYDANNKVMRDPYSLYAEKTVADLVAGNYSTIGNVGVPSNIGSDYVVYVNDNSSTKPIIAGYRNGDRWYDPYGREVSDPKILQNEYTSGSNNLQPYLVDPTDNIQKATADMLNRSFVDYKPQVNVSPRLQFTFPVNDLAQLYANYDVVIQRPKGSNTTGIGNINYLDPATYYYFEQDQSLYLGNSNLKPERLIQYEIGFQQVLSKEARSVLTLSTFYKERKDQIQVRPYFYAYPKTYNAFGNRDFSTSKGFRVKIETKLGKSRIDRPAVSNIMVSYQLAFTDGTGSSTTSQLSLIRSGQGSLRPTSFYLNNDVRHNIKVNLYTEVYLTDGSSTFIRRFINGIGTNFMANLRSGTPYTRYAIPIVYEGSGNGDPIIGSINGTRLPWSINFDVKINKDIVLRKSKIMDDGSIKPVQAINIFAYVQNIFNIKNVLDVYNYTGSPYSDGYLNSSYGQQAISRYAEVQQQSYIDMYNMALYNQPTFFNTPRRITLGLNYNF